MACDVPGREADLERLLAIYAEMAAEGGGGRTVFVAGEEGSGRSALLRAATGELGRVTPRPVVLAGGFQDGRYEPRAKDAFSVSKVITTLDQIVTLTQPLLPIAGLIGQVLHVSKAARGLAHTLRAQGNRRDPSELASALLAELCREGPVVCLIDDADRAPDAWWGDLVYSFAAQIARTLPLLLVLAIEGPQELGGHQDDETYSLYAARRLTRPELERELALWHPLGSVTVEDLARWTGPAATDLLQDLLEISSARAQWSAQIWDEWRERGIVQQADSDMRWRFAAGGRERALNPARWLTDRLTDLVGDKADDVRELLSCAALEGRRFTAEAVARALGRDRDAVIDVFDDALTADELHPVGLVVEAGAVHVSDETGERHLWLYRFPSWFAWWTLRHHTLAEGGERRLSLALANAIQALYGGQAHRVALTLTRLYETAGSAEQARRYRRMGELGVSREIILWRACNVLNAPHGSRELAERRRASQILIAAAEELLNSGSFKDGLAFAHAAHELAPLKRDQASALYLMGAHRGRLGANEQAQAELRRALRLWRELSDRGGEAAARHGLASIDLEQGAYEQARAEYARVLELRRELGHRHGEVAARHQLALIDLELGAYERAFAELVRVLDLTRELGNRQGEAHAHHGLARVGSALGAYEEARLQYAHALELSRELGDRHGEAAARHGLASINLHEGAYDRARGEMARVVELQRELGDRRGEAASWHQLGAIAFEQGAHEQARAEFAHALALKRELGDRPGEAITRHALATIDVEERAYKQARTEFTRLTEFWRELGNAEGEAAAREGLAAIDDAIAD